MATSSSASDAIGNIHWLFGILQNIDVGLVVLNRRYEVQLWNGFMEDHSGHRASDTIGHDLFELFPDIPAAWLKRKIDSVFLLKHRAFATWHQRPYLMRFNSYRSITGDADWMYQNLTIFPLMALTGSIDHVCLIIYDVTDTALDEIALQQANAELDRLGRTDGLTGLHNRRSWELQLEQELRRHRRSGRTAALVMFDIDHFKRVNDTYGHQAGDAVIRAVAQAAADAKREVDIAGRYGGEEFGVVLIETDSSGAIQFAERLRQQIEATPIHHEGITINVTISLGVAVLESDITNCSGWIEQADQALYRSKKGGRNRVS